jgi:hypothetical protein
VIERLDILLPALSKSFDTLQPGKF